MKLNPARRWRLHLRRRIFVIESIEGKRGLPRHRPPYVAEGIFGRPTLVQNGETLYWLPDILNEGRLVLVMAETVAKGYAATPSPGA